MFEEKNNLADNEKETARLREVVLSWVDHKKTDKSTSQKISQKKELSAKSVFKKQSDDEKKSGILIKITKAIISILILLIVFAIYLYTLNPINVFSAAVTSVLPYPAIIVDNQVISYYEWQKQVSALREFYHKEQQSNDIEIPNIKETKNHVANRLIDKTILEQLAEGYNISVHSEEIEQKTQELIEKVGGEERLKQQLQELYNWNINDFQSEIIRPVILKEKVSIAMTLDNNINEDARKQAEEILQQVKTSPNNFSELAQKHSQDITASFGGSIGYFAKGEMVPEFEEAVFSLKPGEISELVKTQYGYHIIFLEEYLYDDNNQLTQAKAKHILIRTKDLQTYLTELKDNKKIFRLVN